MNFDDYPRCPATGKVSHTTEESAQRHADEQADRREAAYAPYWCHDCGALHVGRDPRDIALLIGGRRYGLKDFERQPDGSLKLAAGDIEVEIPADWERLYSEGP